MHFATYTASPCLGVPLPGGRPLPSGLTVRSQDAISSGVATRPRFGLTAAKAAPQTTTSAEPAARRWLRVNMLHLPVLGYAPAGDAVGVVVPPLPAIGDHLGACRLDIAAVVRRAALQDGRSAVPTPCYMEARQRQRQHRSLQRRRRPAFAAVGRNLDLGDLAVTRPGEAANRVKPRSLERQSGRWMRDHRLGFDRQNELERFPVRLR